MQKSIPLNLMRMMSDAENCERMTLDLTETEMRECSKTNQSKKLLTWTCRRNRCRNKLRVVSRQERTLLPGQLLPSYKRYLCEHTWTIVDWLHGKLMCNMEDLEVKTGLAFDSTRWDRLQNKAVYSFTSFPSVTRTPAAHTLGTTIWSRTGSEIMAFSK